MTNDTAGGDSDGGGGEDVEALKHRIEVLEHDLEEEHQGGDHGTAGVTPPKRRRGRTIGSWVLIVVACLLAVLSVVVVYARNELLNTDTFVATVAPLAKDKAVQTTVATKVSESLVAKSDLEQRVRNALPPKAGFLVDPITSGVQTATYDITLRLVQSSRFQSLWEDALRQSHEQVDNLLLGKKVGALQSTNGEVTVDLSQIEAAAKKQLSAHGLSVVNKAPNYTGAPFVLFQSDQLAKLQRWIKLLNNLALVLPIVAVLLFAGAVLLAKDRRRGLVHASAGLAVSMAVLLIAANVGRNQYLASLKPNQSTATAAAVIDTVDASLLDSVRTVLIVAAVIAVIAFVLGLGPVTRWIETRNPPAWMTGGPVHDTVAAHRKAFQWLVVVLGLVVLVLWNQPTVAVALIIVLVTLFVVMLVGLYGRTPKGGGTPPAVGPGPGADPELATTASN